MLFRIWVQNPTDRILRLDKNCSLDLINYFMEYSDLHTTQRASMLIHDQEPLLYRPQKKTWDEWRFTTSSFDDRMLILHSEQNSDELAEFCNEMQATSCHWFSNGALAHDWYHKIMWNLRSLGESHRPRLHYKFSCLNRLINHTRCYRPVFSRILMTIVDHAYLRLSCSLTDPIDNIKSCDLRIPNRYQSLFHNLNMATPITINIEENDLELGRIKNQSFSTNTSYFNKVFCHIATETLFTESTLHLTEKSLRSFIHKRPMLLLGPPHSLSYLRSYGFKTFSDFWDESYDMIKDPWQRMEAVIELVKKIDKLTLDDMEDMLDKMKPILDHNYRHFFYDFPDKIMNELISNMQSAITDIKARKPNGWMLKYIENFPEIDWKQALDGQLDEGITSKEVYDSMSKGDNTKIRRNLARLLIYEMGFDKESSKKDIIARLHAILD